MCVCVCVRVRVCVCVRVAWRSRRSSKDRNKQASEETEDKRAKRVSLPDSSKTSIKEEETKTTSGWDVREERKMVELGREDEVKCFGQGNFCA